MAKERIAKSHATPRRGRPKSENPKVRKPVAITLRAGSGWIAWLDRFSESLAKEVGFPKPDRTAMIDYALKRLALERKFEEPPPRY